MTRGGRTPRGMAHVGTLAGAEAGAAVIMPAGTTPGIVPGTALTIPGMAHLGVGAAVDITTITTTRNITHHPIQNTTTVARRADVVMPEVHRADAIRVDGIPNVAALR